MYIGRFAPSPTGPMHFGSLVTAVASYLDAKHHEGLWKVRMEDLDQPRVVKDSDKAIIDTLHQHGFQWDDEIIYQSHRIDIYENYISNLNQNENTYYCECSRKEIADSAITGIDGMIYPGTCRDKKLGSLHHALRIKVEDVCIAFKDKIQGAIEQNILRDFGDFILKRSDGIYAYQLAVVIDDALQNINTILRGADLIDSTSRQIYLQEKLFLPPVNYSHIPVATFNQKKLSKENQSTPIEHSNIKDNLIACLKFLGQDFKVIEKENTLKNFWDTAIQLWDLSLVPKIRTIEI
ncbi:MAG TPA: tRNA glutamyl-Q(34) synthetase GluQRS [Methylophilaceae bacterium]|nr:tRNA glutamyl-Q(34) synthetase GluQRS [Methylophilaceae bacterium]